MKSKLITFACAIYIIYAIVIAQDSTVQLLSNNEGQQVCTMHVASNQPQLWRAQELTPNCLVTVIDGNCSSCLAGKIKSLRAQGYRVYIYGANEDVAKQFKVRRCPTLIILTDGKEVKRFAGKKTCGITEATIKEYLQKN